MTPSVLVAGAGPTGLVLGIEMARRGVPVRVVDRAAAPAAGSRGDGLQPRTLEVFDDLGVLDAVLAAGVAPSHVRAYAGGRYTGEKRMGELREPTPDVPYPNGHFLGQDRTEAILRARLTELGGRVEFATALEGFAQDADGVTATLAGPAGRETVRAAVLVGADGGASTVRRTLGIPFEGRTDESVRMLIGDVRVAGLDHTCGHMFTDEHDQRRGMFLSPLPGEDLFQFATPLENGTAEPEQIVHAAFAEFCGLPGVAIREVAWSTVWRPNVRLAARYRAGRVFLAGDAAHTHPPTGGQGLNTGVQDAYNLGWKLAAALAGRPDADALLDSYEAERRPVAAHVLGLSEELLRRHVEGADDAHERGPETQQLDIGYRGSPIVRDERARPGRLHAGDRAPDGPVVDAAGRPLRLFDLFRGPHATLLVFGDPAPGTVPADARVVLPAGRTATGTAVVDAQGFVAAAYDVPDGTAVLVRPDGYVGAIGDAGRMVPERVGAASRT
ncbi:FAD-dependent monooxygenase [Pseudonocardia zijingensis]|uniref:FAD-dependent monooxygenase n=1 Tax=Pseudonocardia zijingensis TaxID=153376 RepID=A0ABN1NB77_9PSEU